MLRLKLKQTCYSCFKNGNSSVKSFRLKKTRNFLKAVIIVPRLKLKQILNSYFKNGKSSVRSFRLVITKNPKNCNNCVNFNGKATDVLLLLILK